MNIHRFLFLNPFRRTWHLILSLFFSGVVLHITSSKVQAASSFAESTVIAVDTRDPYDAWTQDGGLSGTNSLPLVAPQGDGVTNLLKYAFNMNAAAADTHSVGPLGNSGLPDLEIRLVDGQPRLHVRAIRRRNDSSLVYTAEFSSTTGNWQHESPSVPVEIVPLGELWERVTYRDPVSDPAQSRRFGRVNVTVSIP